MWRSRRRVRPSTPRVQGACLAFAALFSFCVAAPARAQGAPDEQALPVGARATALGGAITAVRGPEAVFGNPAGLAALGGSQFVIHHSDDATVDLQVDAFSFLFSPSSATIGLSYQLFDWGETGVVDQTGQPTGELTFRDHLVVASFALPLAAGFSTGVNYKVLQERIDCTGLCGDLENLAITQVADIGVQYAAPWSPDLGFGLSVVNVRVAPRESSDQPGPLPSRIRFGVVYNLLAAAPTDSLVALRLAVEVRDRLTEPGSPTLAYGLELDVQRAVFLRAGYTPGEGLGKGAAVGLELRYDRFDIGVSRSFANSLLEGDEEPFQVSVGLHF